ncbi:carbohydrate sulfotransferase 5-like [Ambystoma mexicanum]|uniref:carbohydrate sulfotransferase 5-like n=1 Tax=Ambystoma mexicanum TaxID=8296 RepID=UPI0037E8BDBD
MKVPRFSGTFAVVLALSQAVLFVCIIFVLHRGSSSLEKQPDRTHILIISSWRSGSSLAGQLFSQHPDVFYLMEPAWHVWTAMKENRAKVLHMAVRDLIRSVFLCDMSVFDAYLPETRIKSNLFQWEASRALCSPPACEHFKRTDIIPQVSCKILCGKYPFDSIEQACKTYSHIVLKEVRFFDLKVLYPLLHDPSLNLKILHLIRDPRAVFHSRQKLKKELTRDNNIMVGPKNNKKGEGIYKIMEEICKSHSQIYKTATQALPSRLRNRYMMIRFEDMVKNPLETAEKMYSFAGLQYTPKLKMWLYNMTHGNGIGKKFIITSRNAQLVSKAWRDNVPFEKILLIQQKCNDAMDLLGYQLVHSEMEQKNMTSDLLLTPQGTHSRSLPNS